MSVENTLNNRWFSEQWLERIDKNVAESTGLPNALYTDPEFLRFENEQLLPSAWILAGFTHQAPNTGDVIPIEVAEKPLILLHDENDEIQVFHNACPHRGAKLVNSLCSGAKALVCPNHFWTYGLDGKIQARPHFFGGDQHDIHEPGKGPQGLRPVRSAVWHDLIFINLDGKAGTFEQYIKPMADRLKGYDLASLQHVGVLEWELNCNWKLVHENFIEPYHVFAVHPGLLEFGPMDKRRASEHEAHCFFNDYQFPNPDSNRGDGLPHFPNPSKTMENQVLWFHLFPTLSLEIFPNQMAVWELIPISPEKTLERIHVYLIGDTATSEEFAEGRQKVFDTWHGLNEEDIGVIERMQQGRHSPGFDGGTLSPFWDSAIQHYARLMAGAVKSKRAKKNQTKE
ncbi:MAG TPA: aromatic ring-hydroxylating dioxygenase subunit alpha [Candidatus Thioglobus sp.]|jgi:choline monooxygenase|nr:aromatic ring-hydroxylating dioxygenase subunit alpha [Candidatus Thioglobus sp.]